MVWQVGIVRGTERTLVTNQSVFATQLPDRRKGSEAATKCHATATTLVLKGFQKSFSKMA
ncbi:MAG TPA: hypothetical protein DEV81_00800 [Cyanobacteria bacterium UBA11049]|nr:hypothetical protein [Cyanobacteria bacterium UBA11049]